MKAVGGSVHHGLAVGRRVPVALQVRWHHAHVRLRAGRGPPHDVRRQHGAGRHGARGHGMHHVSGVVRRELRALATLGGGGGGHGLW